MIVFSDQVWKRIGTFCRQVRSLDQAATKAGLTWLSDQDDQRCARHKGKRGNGAQKLKRNKKK